MKKFFNLFKISSVVVVFAMLCSGCGLNNSENDKKFRVGMECSYAPFNWIQPTKAHGAVKIAGGWYACGYDVYMAKKIATALGRELEIVKVDWDGLLPALTSGKIDAIIAGMSATEERKQTIDFTDNYYNSNIVIVTKKSSCYSGAKALSDLGMAKITGQLSTVHYNLIDQIPNVNKQTPMEDFSSMISAVTAGKIDGYISEKPAAMVAVYTNPLLTYIDFEEGKGFNFSQDDVAVAIGLRKGSSLKGEINKVLKNISLKDREELMSKAVACQPAAAN